MTGCEREGNWDSPIAAALLVCRQGERAGEESYCQGWERQSRDSKSKKRHSSFAFALTRTGSVTRNARDTQLGPHHEQKVPHCGCDVKGDVTKQTPIFLCTSSQGVKQLSVVLPSLSPCDKKGPCRGTEEEGG